MCIASCPPCATSPCGPWRSAQSTPIKVSVIGHPAWQLSWRSVPPAVCDWAIRPLYSIAMWFKEHVACEICQ